MSKTVSQTIQLYREMGLKTHGRLSVSFDRDSRQWVVSALVRMNDGGLRMSHKFAEFKTVEEAVDFEANW